MTGKIASAVRAVVQVGSRFGWGAAFIYAVHQGINKIVRFDCLHIIALDRSRILKVKPELAANVIMTVATADQLTELREDPAWGISEKLVHNFSDGDRCLLSYYSGELAGYTWVHAQGRPELLPGVSISIPSDYLYNYAGLTLPKFRGVGLQPCRHNAVLTQAEWVDKKGLIGFVAYTNFSSRRGQGKSGYRKIGSIWLVGRSGRLFTYVTQSLRKLGIDRLS